MPHAFHLHPDPLAHGLRTYPMKRICGWCGKPMPGGDGVADRPGVVTHGICPKCVKAAEAKAKDRKDGR
jgi:hypothetical protein